MTQTARTKLVIGAGTVLCAIAVASPMAAGLAFTTVFGGLTDAADWFAAWIKHLVA